MEADWSHTERRCPVVIKGRTGTGDGDLACIFARGHRVPHRFMAPDSTLRWWPVGLGDPPAWDEAISTPATDPRWSCLCCCWVGEPCPIHDPEQSAMELVSEYVIRDQDVIDLVRRVVRCHGCGGLRVKHADGKGAMCPWCGSNSATFLDGPPPNHDEQSCDTSTALAGANVPDETEGELRNVEFSDDPERESERPLYERLREFENGYLASSDKAYVVAAQDEWPIAVYLVRDEAEEHVSRLNAIAGTPVWAVLEAEFHVGGEIA